MHSLYCNVTCIHCGADQPQETGCDKCRVELTDKLAGLKNTGITLDVDVILSLTCVDTMCVISTIEFSNNYHAHYVHVKEELLRHIICSRACLDEPLPARVQLQQGPITIHAHPVPRARGRDVQHPMVLVRYKHNVCTVSVWCKHDVSIVLVWCSYRSSQ
jgi:hypothetical protein